MYDLWESARDTLLNGLSLVTGQTTTAWDNPALKHQIMEAVHEQMVETHGWLRKLDEFVDDLPPESGVNKNEAHRHIVAADDAVKTLMRRSFRVKMGLPAQEGARKIGG
jgi:hypothetical protein